MKQFLWGILFVLCLSACSPTDNNYLVKFEFEGQMGTVSSFGYLSAKGDTVIPVGKYVHTFADTIQIYGVVMKGDGRLFGINNIGGELFEVYKFDNGPDYVSSGLFRILKDGKIGYANQLGEIIIAPQFKCAYPFEGSSAKVAVHCKNQQEGEHQVWKSDDWFKIGKDGKRID